MKALSKTEMRQRADLVEGIRNAHDELENAIKVYDEIMAAEQEKVKEKMDVLNEKIQEAKEWVEGIALDMQSYFDEKSEDWQEGEKGQNFWSWKEGYENFSADDVDIDFPESIEEVSCEVADDLEDLSDEP